MSTGTIHIPEWTPADRFRKAREDRAISQRQLAEIIRVDKNTVSNYESGRTKRHMPAVAQAWAEATHVPLDWILTGETTGGRGPDTPGSQPKPPTCRYGDSTSTIRVLHAA